MPWRSAAWASHGARVPSRSHRRGARGPGPGLGHERPGPGHIAPGLVQRQRGVHAPHGHEAARLPAGLDVPGQLPQALHARAQPRLQLPRHLREGPHSRPHRLESPLESGSSSPGLVEGAHALATRVQGCQQRDGRQLARGLLVLALRQRVQPVARTGREVVEAQRHAEGEVVHAAQHHVARREVPLRRRPFHLVELLLVGRWELASLPGVVRVPGILLLLVGEQVGWRRGPLPAARSPPLEVPVRTSRELQAPRLQLRSGPGHAAPACSPAACPGPARRESPAAHRRRPSRGGSGRTPRHGRRHTSRWPGGGRRGACG